MTRKTAPIEGQALDVHASSYENVSFSISLSSLCLLQNILLVVVSTPVFYHRRECHLYAGLPFQSLDRKTKISY